MSKHFWVILSVYILSISTYGTQPSSWPPLQNSPGWRPASAWVTVFIKPSFQKSQIKIDTAKTVAMLKHNLHLPSKQCHRSLRPLENHPPSDTFRSSEPTRLLVKPVKCRALLGFFSNQISWCPTWSRTPPHNMSPGGRTTYVAAERRKEVNLLHHREGTREGFEDYRPSTCLQKNLGMFIYPQKWVVFLINWWAQFDNKPPRQKHHSAKLSLY